MSFKTETGKPRYRVGIVGLSWITSEPARSGTHPVLGDAPPHSHLSSLAAIPSAEVVAGCDISVEANDRFLETWSSTWTGLKAYSDYRAMIDAEALDIVCVATPDHQHGDVVRNSAAKGVKGIFCEKPISVSLDDVDSMVASIEKYGTIVNINNTRRWVPVYVESREAVRSGVIGPLSQINVQFGGERAMLWRNHSHLLDLISYFAESEPAWVLGELEADFNDYGTTYKGNGGRSADLEPGVNAYIAYSNGVRGFLNGMKSGAGHISVQLIGSEGRIDANDKHASIIKNSDRGLNQTQISPQSTVQSIQAGIMDLISAMETGLAPQCPPSEARKTVAIIEGILKSHHQGNIRVNLID